MANEEGGTATNTNVPLCMGRYELGRVLGKGNCCVVKLARNIVTGELVTIKIFDKEQLFEGKKKSHRREIKKAIKREISIMRMVKHPNVVRLIEVMATKKNIYMVMEHVADGELFDKISKTSLAGMKEGQAKKYFHQLIYAVDYCHSKGVSHGDIKPENLLVDEDGVLKLSDFGLSTLPEQADVKGLLYTPYGTPQYTAPEVIEPYGYEGPKADIWACGVTLFFMVAGYLPFTNHDQTVLHKKICAADYELPYFFSKDLKRLIKKLLDRDHNSRITIDQLYQDEWFMRYYQPLRFPQEIASFDYSSLVLPTEEEETGSLQSDVPQESPATNALEMCSTYLGFKIIRNLFNKVHAKSETTFISRYSINDIFGEIAYRSRSIGYEVTRRSFQMNINLKEELARRKGHLSVVIKIYEIEPSFHMIEVRKTSGDNLKFHEFYKKVCHGHIILKAEPIEIKETCNAVFCRIISLCAYAYTC